MDIPEVEKNKITLMYSGMEITINNERKTLNEPCTVQDILNQFVRDKQKGIAVAVNQTVIPKTEWTNYLLKPNDDVLIIKATQGG